MGAKGVSFVEGDLKKQIFKYCWPVFISSVFSELYNIINSIIVGNYVSLEALSAVSACTWICNIFSYTFYGLGMGAGILVAKYYGANDKEKLKLTLDSSLLFGLVGGIVISIISEAFLPQLLVACNIGPDIYDYAYNYLRVFFLSSTPVLIYQMCFFIMRSFGDSKRPLYYLILSCFINLGLGILFVRVFDMNVVGTALATIIAKSVVTVLSLIHMFNMNDIIKIKIKEMSFSFETIKDICRLGIPAGIQNMLIALSSLMIQSEVNLFSNEIIAGVGVAEKVAAWGQMVSIAMSSACMILVPQCIGAKKFDRVKEGLNLLKIYSAIGTLISIILLVIFARPLVSLFKDNPDVINVGSTMIYCMSFSYIFLNYSHIYNGACRGSGNVKYPMIIAILGQVIAKYLFVYIGLKICYSEWIIYFGSAFGYSIAGILAIIYFRCSKFTKENHLR